MLGHIPNEKRKCHCCGFEKSCRDLVLSGACERWVKIPWVQHPITGAKFDEYSCIDDQAFAQMLDMQRQVGLTTVEMNALRNEFKTAHDANLALGAIAVQRSKDAIKEAVRDVEERSALRSSESIPLLASS